MSSVLDNPKVRSSVLPISVEQYHRLYEAGIIAANTELLDGVIVEKTVKSPEHTWLVERLVDWLREHVPAGKYVRQEQPLTLANSEPEPDVAVVEGGKDDYRAAHPATAWLVIEVAVASEDVDREKALLYAAANVEEYWIVLANGRAIEVYSDPTPSGYARHETVGGGKLAAKTVDGVELGVEELFLRP